MRQNDESEFDKKGAVEKLEKSKSLLKPVKVGGHGLVTVTVGNPPSGDDDEY